MTLASWIGITASALLLGTTALTVAPVRRFNSAFRTLFFVIPFIAAFVPIQGLAIAGYLRGVIGDLSVTSWILLFIAVVSKLTDRDPHRTKSFIMLFLLILLSGLVLYPSALGVSYLDTYTIGYDAKWLIAIFFFLSLATWLLEYRLVTVSLTASVLAYSLRLFESQNLWDYWIDPLVTIFALFRLAALWWERRATLRWWLPDAND